MYSLIVIDPQGLINQVETSESIRELKAHIPEEAVYHPVIQPHPFLLCLASANSWDFNIIEVTE